jgi:hypothetical protein
MPYDLRGCFAAPVLESKVIAHAQCRSSPGSCEQIIQDMLSQPVHWKLGTVYDYSNFGYSGLGR